MVLVMLVSLSPVNVQAASKVKINKTQTTMYVGTPKTLKVTGTNKKVTWKSSNKKIATVSAKGKVTPKKAGTVVITAKVSGKKYKCKVTVKKPCLSATKKTVKAGSTYKLVLHGTNVKKCSSTNKSIATVKKNGKNAVTVKAVKTGNVKIKVQGTNGKSYVCNVKIKCDKHTWKKVTKHHDAVTHKETKSVKIKDAWDEEVIDTVKHWFCGGCDMDLTAAGYLSVEDISTHVDHCQGGSSYYLYPVSVTKTVHHNATYKDQEVTVTDKEGYWEVTGYKCSLCGATKKEHQHNWVAVKHEAKVKPAWREEVHTTEYHTFCGGCGEDMDEAGHADDYDYYNYHARKCQASYYSKPIDVVSYVDHPEEIIEAAYTSYKCSTCGATK